MLLQEAVLTTSGSKTLLPLLPEKINKALCTKKYIGGEN